MALVVRRRKVRKGSKRSKKSKRGGASKSRTKSRSSSKKTSSAKLSPSKLAKLKAFLKTKRGKWALASVLGVGTLGTLGTLGALEARRIIKEQRQENIRNNPFSADAFIEEVQKNQFRNT